MKLNLRRHDLLFFLVKESDHFRLWPVIGHTIVFTSEKNRPTNQIDSNFQQMNSPFTDKIQYSNLYHSEFFVYSS